MTYSKFQKKQKKYAKICIMASILNGFYETYL